jgi:hypothetical protein
MITGEIPAMDFEQSIAAAGNLAEVIYNLSQQCLMAHTLRACEFHIASEYNKNRFPITLTIEKSTLGKKSWVLVTGDYAAIFIEENLSRDQQRVCIAHECYHILEFFRPIKSHHPKIEDISDEFANGLCKKHNEFYNDPAKIAACKFLKLPINCKG